MTIFNHSNNLCLVTLHFPSSTPPPSSAASPSSPSSTGWTDKITKKIQELNKHLDDLKNLNEFKNYYLPEQDSKSLDSLPTQLTSLETMQKLAEFAEQLDTKNNKPTNILNNLCSGLETFLGFNSATKGYTGQGIVYSDLDRLCDGVMGFLSGVLSNIQDHLGQHKGQIDDAITILNKNKHAGKKGFNVAIGSVVKGVRGYNERVRESNEKINGVINEFIRYVGELTTKISTLNADGIFFGIDEHVQECLEKATDYAVGMTGEKDNIKDLQKHLQQKVDKASEIIVYQRERLSDTWNKRMKDKDSIIKLVNSQLHDAKEHINARITSDIRKLMSDTNQKIGNIQNQIFVVHKTLTQYVKELEQWINNADQTIVASLAKVNAICNEMNGPQAVKKQQLEKAVSQLKQKTLHLLDVHKSAEAGLKILVTKVKTAINGLDNRIREDLNILTSVIDEEIKKYVHDAKQHFKVLKEKTFGPDGDGLNSGINYNWDVLKEDVTTLVGEIYGRGKGLTQILQGVKTYAKGFKQATFVAGLQTWVTEIVEKDKIVEDYIDWYISDIAGDHSSVREQVKNAIELQLPGFINSVIERVAAEVGLDDGVELKDLSKKFATFASEIETALIVPGVGSTVNMAASTIAIQLQSLNLGSSLDLNEHFLKSALEAILSSVAVSTKNFVLELQSFVNTSHICNLYKAIGNVYTIQGKLIDDSTQPGHAITESLSEVKLRMHHLESALNSTIRTQVAAKFQMAHQRVENVKTLMKGYAGYVGETGAIEDAIKELQETAMQPIKETVKTKKVNESDIIDTAKDIVDVKLKALCEAVLAAADAKDDECLRKQLIKLQNSIYKNVDQNNQTKKGLQEIRIDLRDLQENKIHPLIEEMQRIIYDCHSKGEKVIRSLEHDVNTTLDNGSSIIVTNIQTMYVVFMKSQLTAFADKVYNELADFPNAVTKDADKSYKGFMNILQYKLTDNLKVSFDDESNLHDLILNATPFFKELFGGFISNKDILSNASVPQQVYSKIHNMLTGLKYYNCRFVSDLSSLSSLLASIRPASYAENSNPLLECLKTGVQMMHDELDKAYVSVYDGASDGFLWTNAKSQKLTDDANRCAKVGLTVCSILHNAFKNFKQFCSTNWKFHKINKSNDLGSYFAVQGYIVSDEGQQNGELQDKVSMTGKQIHKCLVGSTDYEHVYYIRDDTKLALEMLNDYLTDYYRLCHITHPSTRQPCSVYEMLIWLSGLPCNSVYSDLLLHGLSEPFEDPDKQTKDVGEEHDFILVTPEDLYLDAYPKRITYKNVVSALEHLCSTSYDVLVAIAGTGDANTMYASDYSNNALKLHYPATGEECLGMLLDILRRLFPVMQFLKHQCGVSAKYSGWSQCLYGKTVKSSKWPCDDHSTDEPITQSKCQPNCQANSQPNCQPTSPLMSYLGDCLTGHLPHSMSSIGCKSSCSTCSKSSPGMPCITPLGFKRLSGSAKTGMYLCDVINKFFTNSYIPSLLCLVPTPPRTLPEHFRFALSLANMLNSNNHNTSANAVKTAFNTSTNELSIDLCKDAGNLTSALRNAYNSNIDHEAKMHTEGTKSDLHTLSVAKSCHFPTRNVYCGPYLSTLSQDCYTYITAKHSDAYLSWALYLPWALHSYLEGLQKAFSMISCQDWGCRGCLKDDKCKQGKHGMDYNCQCKGFLECRGVVSVLYSHGFTLGDRVVLTKKYEAKYCHNFYTQISNVLTSNCFRELFAECDKFLFAIRAPFSYLVLALWLLSLLYLLHIMVIRLDLLHIKSHLHSPSSHRIAAQSLLAAARVNKLNRVFYLQP